MVIQQRHKTAASCRLVLIKHSAQSLLVPILDSVASLACICTITYTYTQTHAHNSISPAHTMAVCVCVCVCVCEREREYLCVCVFVYHTLLTQYSFLSICLFVLSARANKALHHLSLTLSLFKSFSDRTRRLMYDRSHETDPVNRDASSRARMKAKRVRAKCHHLSKTEEPCERQGKPLRK